MTLRNPFLNSFIEQEVKFYGLSTYQNGNVEVVHKNPSGRLDDYLNVNFVIGHPEIPVLYIEKKLWMSLTRAEIQGQFVPILMSYGKVGIGGLGLGYVVLRIAEKENVEQIDVYEINPDIISFFKKNFCHRSGFEKINFIQGDIRQNLKNKEYDFFFNDIYQTLLPEEIIDDIALFTTNNKIEEYRFWGLELVKLVLINNNYSYLTITKEEKEFFRLWSKSEGSKMRLVFEDVEFCEEIIENI